MDDVNKLADKKFAYAIIILFLIVIAALTIIGAVQHAGEIFQGGSWYIYCDLEDKTCSCNVYGLLDNPQESQMRICGEFMKEYITEDYKNNHVPRIIGVTANIQ